jgi:heat shock protein HtpX
MARSSRCHELFPVDRGLAARMVAVTVLTPLSIVALVGGSVALLPTKIVFGLAFALLFGAFLAAREAHRRMRSMPPLLRVDEEPELQAIVGRLCVVADLARPEVVVHEDAEPNSWIVDPLGRPPRLHVTRGLLELLEPIELEAVVAHELAHVVHRDATVMTVVAMPVEALDRAADKAPSWYWPLGLGCLVGGVIGWMAGFGSTALSRYRELTADAGAAAMTGRPAALASALMKVSGALANVPTEDLRVVSGCEALHLVAAEEPHRRTARWHGPSHPSIEQRVAALERLEHRLAHGRRA